MITKTLQIDFPRELEHPLFRAAMQVVVGIRQNHNLEMQSKYAEHLETLAKEHLGVKTFDGYFPLDQVPPL